jgi:cob(I)alamin adenosyltransferase
MVDELNSWVGVIKDHCQSQDHIGQQLQLIQDRLFTIGSELATRTDKVVKMSLPEMTNEDILQLERWIDAMDEVLVPLKSFILPGGFAASSFTHIARCVCRRAERLCVQMELEGEVLPPLVMPYLNRLSDYFFTLARFISHLNNAPEVYWTPKV